MRTDDNRLIMQFAPNSWVECGNFASAAEQVNLLTEGEHE
jgi:hypothetical protein